jgi:F-type H+-transporting ATPase subunit epsilon
MQLEILTPKGLEYKDEVMRITLPTRMGQISVLPQHEPLISVLKAGIMSIKTNKEEKEIEIEGGILEIAGGAAVILLKKF